MIVAADAHTFDFIFVEIQVISKGVMDEYWPLEAFLNASVKAGKLSDFWGPFNKTVTSVFTSVAIVLESKNNSYTTGNPGSVIVPQYGSSKITVFVWGKNIILTFLGNTK